MYIMKRYAFSTPRNMDIEQTMETDNNASKERLTHTNCSDKGCGLNKHKDISTCRNSNHGKSVVRYGRENEDINLILPYQEFSIGSNSSKKNESAYSGMLKGGAKNGIPLEPVGGPSNTDVTNIDSFTLQEQQNLSNLSLSARNPEICVHNVVADVHHPQDYSPDNSSYIHIDEEISFKLSGINDGTMRKSVSRINKNIKSKCHLDDEQLSAVRLTEDMEATIYPKSYVTDETPSYSKNKLDTVLGHDREDIETPS